MILKRFYPTECAKSVYEMDFEAYYKKGIRGIIFDIDNTLVPHGAPADEAVIALFDNIHSIGLKTCLISNNKEKRVKPFAQLVKSQYIFDAHKPSVKNYKKAVKIMGITEYTFYWRSDFYGYLRGESCRYYQYSCESNPCKRRDSNYIKEVSRKNCIVFL